MRSGDVIAERFVLEAPAGAGGMGVVFRARDLHALEGMEGTEGTGGARVAVKILAEAARDAERFAREARLLAELRHPAIVPYIASGVTPSGAPYLVMRWLDGEDLAQRLAREPLSTQASMALCTRIAGALAVAHARGVVHRDVKPANIFLPGGDVREAVLLDFGIARTIGGTRALTATGTVIGTAGYMAPEQAEGSPRIDARADVFSLGCVLFECLAGRPAFVGAHPIALLARLLLDEPPRLRDCRPDLPAALDALVAKMLARDPAARVADGAAVVRALGAIDAGNTLAAGASEPRAVLTHREQRFLAAIIAPFGGGLDGDATIAAEAVRARVNEIEPVARSFGGETRALGAIGILVSLAGDGAPADRAVRAARCALSLRALVEGPVALATGFGEATGGAPVGSLAERGAALFRHAASERGEVLVDRDTAALIESRFEIAPSGGVFLLLAERAAPGARRLLGRVSPCVGRDREARTLEALFEECVDEGVARVVVVTGDAGIGKSRLLSEFLTRVTPRATAVLLARADPLSEGSPFDLASQWVRQAAGIDAAATPAAQYAALRSHVRSLGTLERSAHAVEFLGELARLPESVDASPLLRAARGDAALMAVQVQRAFDAWLAALAATGPLVIAADDVHWGDAASIALLDKALHGAGERPVLIALFGRPSTREVFPRLLASHAPLDVALAGLTRRSAERLVRSALGERAREETVGEIVDRAAGNAFFLEELIRHVVEGRGAEFPANVLATVHARLEALDDETRRLVRAASVFGQRFWLGGVARLLGTAPARAAALIADLDAREIFEPDVQTRFAGESQVSFRHALIREAAYASLTDADRARAHRAAAAWLVEHGEVDFRALAEHFDRGGDKLQAASYLAEAADAANVGGAVGDGLALAQRGLENDPPREVRGTLLLFSGFSLFMQDRLAEAVGRFIEATELLPRDSERWLQAAGNLIAVSTWSNQPELAMPVLAAILSGDAPMRPTYTCASAVSLLAIGLLRFGQLDAARELMDRLARVRESTPRPDPAFLGSCDSTLAYYALVGHGTPAQALRASRAARSRCDEGGAIVVSLVSAWIEAWALMDAGMFDEAESVCSAIAPSIQRAVPVLTPWVEHIGVGAAIRHRASPELILAQQRLADSTTDAQLAVSARAEAAYGLLTLERFDEAAREARAGAALGAQLPLARAMCLAALAAALLGSGDPRGALEATTEGLEARACGIATAAHSALLDRAHAEALAATGQEEAARRWVAAARDRLHANAATFDGDLAEARTRYLAQPEHAQLLALAERWGA